ncbi:MAG: hypothetical protein HY650_03905 [Acidobacteria bacterium]|nr:hypothetical protein [Acidobacteriota bacterium]
MTSPEGCAAFLRDDLHGQLAAVRPDLAAEGGLKVVVEPLWDYSHVFKVSERWRTIQFMRSRRKAGDDGSPAHSG